MNVLSLAIFILIFVLEHLKTNYLLVNINGNTIDSFIRSNNVDRTSLITSEFRAGKGESNRRNPRNGKTIKGAFSKRRPNKEEPIQNGPSPCKKKKVEECDEEEGNV